MPLYYKVFVFSLEMLNFYAHFLCRRTEFTASTDVIVTIFTSLAEQDLFLFKVPKIAFRLQQGCKFRTKSKASGVVPDLHFSSLPHYWNIILTNISHECSYLVLSAADQRAVKYKLHYWQINGNYGKERGGITWHRVAKVSSSLPGQLLQGKMSVNALAKEWNPAVRLT